MVDCGLFQGNDAVRQGGNEIVDGDYLHFDLKGLPPIAALIVTHAHIDHIGRLPYLIAAGFNGSILCSQPTAKLLPLVIEDALKVGFTQNRSLIDRFLKRVNSLVIPLPYKKWYDIDEHVKVKLQPAGHILGSSYVEIDVNEGKSGEKKRVVFSGDLGPPYTPILKTPVSPYRADWLVLESTYGDREHEKRAQRRRLLEDSLRKAVSDNGTVLIPAFSLGRTQELLYELNSIFSKFHRKGLSDPLGDLEVIVDSPLAAKFTDVYKDMEPFWDNEAQRKIRYGDHPLVFRQLRAIDDIRAHFAYVNERLKSSGPALVIAASGMCNGGRIMSYLKALISNPLTNIIFTGYQADGTSGRIIQKYGPKKGYVTIV
jgi:metallo-beta-lactamase family protein